MSRLVLGSLIVHQVLVILARVDLVCGRSGLFFVSPLLFLRALLIFASTRLEVEEEEEDEELESLLVLLELALLISHGVVSCGGVVIFLFEPFSHSLFTSMLIMQEQKLKIQNSNGIPLWGVY